MKKKILAVGLIAVLAVLIGIAAVMYFQEQSNPEAQEADTYTIEGTLCYCPGNAIFPGISVTSIIPSVSPWPSNITFTQPLPEKSVNITASSFIYLQFSNKFKISKDVGQGFPVGFDQGEVVRIQVK